jgi:hypothetical protein
VRRSAVSGHRKPDCAASYSYSHLYDICLRVWTTVDFTTHKDEIVSIWAIFGIRVIFIPPYWPQVRIIWLSLLWFSSYYCSTYYKVVRVGGGGQWRTFATRDYEPRTVWTSLSITH